VEETMSDNSSGQVPLPEPEAAGLFDRAVVLVLGIGCLGTRRKVPTSAVQVDADKTLLHLGKEILEAAELDAIKSFDGDLRTWIAKKALPSPLRRGTYLIPLGLVEEMDARLESYRARRAELVEAFIRAYDRAKDEARQRLGPLFNPMDYPCDEKVRAAFSLDVRYVAFGVPGKLESLNRDIWERERAKAESNWREASEEVRQALRVGLADLVDRMVERLDTNGDGKPKVFRDTLVTNLSEFIESFAPRNITDDAELGRLVDRCRGVLDGVDADALRASTAVRSKVRDGMARVQVALDSMVIDRPARRIVLEE
jgi:hypothetical protein